MKLDRSMFTVYKQSGGFSFPFPVYLVELIYHRKIKKIINIFDFNRVGLYP